MSKTVVLLQEYGTKVAGRAFYVAFYVAVVFSVIYVFYISANSPLENSLNISIE
jgi:uncharacterized PurR-regulated membrane protein YhhQ (DUF165 family)